MNRTSWPVLKSAAQQLKCLLLALFTITSINLIHAEDAHHMTVKCLSKTPTIGLNTFLVEMKTKSEVKKSDDARTIIVKTFSIKGEELTKTVQVSQGKAEFELDLQKGPNLITITDSTNPLLVAYASFTASLPESTDNKAGVK